MEMETHEAQLFCYIAESRPDCTVPISGLLCVSHFSFIPFHFCLFSSSLRVEGRDFC
jgi:hypothetical protein